MSNCQPSFGWYSNQITTAFIDPCGKATSSITDDLKEPLVLSQLSDINFEKYQVKMKIPYLKKK